MSRYGDNCEAHDLPRDECVYCVREALDKSVAEIDRLKAELVKWRELHDSEITRSENLQHQLAEARAEVARLKLGMTKDYCDGCWSLQRAEAYNRYMCFKYPW